MNINLINFTSLTPWKSYRSQSNFPLLAKSVLLMKQNKQIPIVLLTNPSSTNFNHAKIHSEYKVVILPVEGLRVWGSDTSLLRRGQRATRKRMRLRGEPWGSSERQALLISWQMKAKQNILEQQMILMARSLVKQEARDWYFVRSVISRTKVMAIMRTRGPVSQTILGASKV